MSALPSVAELGRALREGTTTARELAELALANATHGAYRTLDAAHARAQAAAADAAFAAGRDLGPLQGLPLSVKDLYGVPGLPTFAGAPTRLPPRFELAGPVVARALAQ
ncbi:MAG: amidase family protein, partial [Myxococcota bacterium]